MSLISDVALQSLIQIVKLQFLKEATRITTLEDNVHNLLRQEIEGKGNTFSVGESYVGTKHHVLDTTNELGMEGQTLVNLWDINSLSYEASKSVVGDNQVTITQYGTSHTEVISYNVHMFKPNTEYTLITYVTENTSEKEFFLHKYYQTSSVFTDESLATISAGQVGVFVNKLQTKSDFSEASYAIRSAIAGGSGEYSYKIVFNHVLLEGDHTDKSIEYFEGLQSSGEYSNDMHNYTIKSVGKNLFNIEEEAMQVVNESGAERYAIIFDKIGTYTFSCLVAEGASISFKYLYGNTYGDYFAKMGNVSHTFTLAENEKFIIYIGTEGMRISSYISNGQIEKGTVATEYEPYVENVTTVQLSEPLRSLPNGVRDTAEIIGENLVVTRNCGEHVFDGTEYVVKINNTSYSDTILRYDFYNTEFEIGNDKVLKDVLCPVFKNIFSNTEEGFRTHGLAHTLMFFATPSTLGGELTASEFVEWLISNNITVVGVLSEPYTEIISLAQLPQLYINGHCFIDTGAIPLNTTTHTVLVDLEEKLSETIVQATANLQLALDHEARLTALE